MRRKRKERFHKEIVSFRYRNKRTGAYVSPLTKKGKKRKNIVREKYRTLLTSDKETGKIRKYGSIREPSRQSLARSETKGSNLYLKGFFRRAAIWEKAVKARATGVMVTIRGKGKRNKDTAIRTKIIFDKAQINNPDYMMQVVLAKIMQMLANRELRLSDAQITSHKKYSQIKNVNVTVDYYSQGDAEMTEEDDNGEEENQWEDGHSSISEPKKKKKRSGKPKRKPRLKSLRLTRKTTRKGKSRS